MDRLRRGHKDEASDEWRELGPRRDAPREGDAESLLELQAQAGNRAVTELVGVHGADAGRSSVQRDLADGTQTATPDADKGAKPRVDTLSIPELNLAVPVLSFEGSQSGRRGPGEEVTVTFAPEHMTARLWEAMTKGREFGTVTVTLGPMTVTLRGVIITAAQMSPNAASLTLNCSKMVIDPGPQQPPGPSDWGE